MKVISTLFGILQRRQHHLVKRSGNSPRNAFHHSARRANASNAGFSSHVFFPDVSPARTEVLTLVLALAVQERVKAGCLPFIMRWGRRRGGSQRMVNISC